MSPIHSKLFVECPANRPPENFYLRGENSLKHEVSFKSNFMGKFLKFDKIQGGAKKRLQNLALIFFCEKFCLWTINWFFRQFNCSFVSFQHVSTWAKSNRWIAQSGIAARMGRIGFGNNRPNHRWFSATIECLYRGRRKAFWIKFNGVC